MSVEGKRAQGGKELKAYRAGKRLTLRQAVLAKCYECMAGYVDGRNDCEIPDCPLYPKMPYGGARKSRRIASAVYQK